DLRAPLRAIGGFAAVVAEDHGAALDEDGRRCLGRIQSSVRSMSGLIDSLLELASAARAPLRRDLVDLSALARELMDELCSTRRDRRVHVEIEPELLVRGDRALLRIALCNLLGNAWKYTSRRDDARIHFGCQPGREPTFFVRDNGAGFDMAHARRLFAPFQRLHRADEFEGSGVGLTTVQRVVHRHGGRIWADAAPGSGASFFFTVPVGA
ncbi:MAG: PAS domain-containing sensor histidine kinase, partial [Myxococcales bacterium]|nr:PAS domain-containing sensor histidine kinase [Myxococcales bacterium]